MLNKSQTKMKTRILIHQSIIVLLLYILQSTSILATVPIKIAVVGPMTHLLGQDHRDGAKLAIEEINGKGGIKIGGEIKKLKLYVVDTNEIMDPDGAVKKLAKVISQENPSFIVGGFRSEAVLGMQQYAMEKKMIFIVCGAAFKHITNLVERFYEKYKYTFRIMPLDHVSMGTLNQMILMYVLDEVKSALGIKNPKIAVVAEDAFWTGDMLKAIRLVRSNKIGGKFRSESELRRYLKQKYKISSMRVKLKEGRPQGKFYIAGGDLTPKKSEKTPGSSSLKHAEKLAMTFIKEEKELFNLQDPEKELKNIKSGKYKNGHSVEYHRYVAGARWKDMRIFIYIDGHGKIKGVSGTISSPN